MEAGWLRDGLSIEGLSVAERSADGGEALVEVDRITFSCGLLDVVRGAARHASVLQGVLKRTWHEKCLAHVDRSHVQQHGVCNSDTGEQAFLLHPILLPHYDRASA